MGHAQSRGPEEMVLWLTTESTGIWGHCDKENKTCGLPMNKHPTCKKNGLYNGFSCYKMTVTSRFTLALITNIVYQTL